MIIAKSKSRSHILLPQMANRHGLIAGATGTGKTTTLRVIAEGFSRLGVPVFMADIKGDLSGISQPGAGFAERTEMLGLNDFQSRGYPTLYWDLYGVNGHPIHTPLGDISPLLLSRLLDLNNVQTGVVTLAYKVAREEFTDSTLLSLGCLKSLLKHLSENANKYSREYGNITPATVGVVQRAILELEEQQVNTFFNLPKFDISDFFCADSEGRGVIHLLDAKTLINNPKLYSTFLLWLILELYEKLEEVGDLAKPRFVFFFDEAHLLFNDVPKILLDKIEQIVRLIRSKGVGIYFVTQNPLDIPKSVLGQLGNRIQHALRAFTPEDYTTVRKVAKTFRQNPAINIVESITNMGTGEALLSLLQEDGSPSIVDRAFVCPPESRLHPLTNEERDLSIKNSAIYGRYENVMFTEEEKYVSTRNTEKQGEYLQSLSDGAIRSLGNQVGKAAIRGIFNTLFRK